MAARVVRNSRRPPIGTWNWRPIVKSHNVFLKLVLAVLGSSAELQSTVLSEGGQSVGRLMPDRAGRCGGDRSGTQAADVKKNPERCCGTAVSRTYRAGGAVKEL